LGLKTGHKNANPLSLVFAYQKEQKTKKMESGNYKQGEELELQQQREYANTFPLKVLIWGASGSNPDNYKERCRLKNYLIDLGHEAKFSEEFEKDPSRLIDPIHDEILQARTRDVVVVLYEIGGTQSEVDRIILPYPDIAEKSIIIIKTDVKETVLNHSVSGEGWKSLLINNERCFEYSQLPLKEELFEKLKQELQRRRQKKAVGILQGGGSTLFCPPKPSERFQPPRKTSRMIKFLPKITEDAPFYKKVSIIDELVNSPNNENLEVLLNIIEDDKSACLYFYGGKDNKTFPDFDWVEFLFKAGEFDDLDTITERGKLTPRFKADFIKEAAHENPNAVLEVITSVKPKDEWIQRAFLEAVEKMPLELSEKAIWLIWDYIGEKRTHIWHWQGIQTAQIMLTLMNERPNLAFAIARLLLEVWSPDDIDNSGSKDVCIRFTEHDYAEFVETFYKPLWEKYPYRAFKLLVQNLDAYLNEVNRKKEFDISEHYYISVEKIDDGSKWKHQSFISIYMNALRDCLNYLIEHEPNAIEKTLELLCRCNKAIFTRFEIYLLSKVGNKNHQDRINEIAGTERYFEDSCYDNEYDLLVSMKKEWLTSEIKEKILKWIEKITVRYPDELKEWYERTKEQEFTDDVLKRYEARYRAQRLYSIQDVFSDEYDKYKQLSGASDESLKPTPIDSGEARFVPGDEGTPLTREQMDEMAVNEVLDYLLDPEHYTYTPKEHQSFSPKEALGYAFQVAVKARPIDFINADIERIGNLPESFMSRYFSGLWDALRENKIEGFDWDRYLGVAQAIVDKHKDNPEIAVRLRPLVECLQEGFKDVNKIEYSVDRLNLIFSIVEPLLSVHEEKDTSNERDPIQTRCVSVTGEIFLVCLSLGIVFKHDFTAEFEATFKAKLEIVFHRFLTEINTPWTVCTFGSDFPRIYWLAPEWVEQNLTLILTDENWDTVWGSYLHWSRPSKDLFNFLRRQGIYQKAIEKKDDFESRGSKQPAEELARHFVIAYFNGWMESYEDELLQAFLNAASDELLSYTADFFTTGFKSQKEKPQEGVNERLKAYWKERLEVIEDNPIGHFNEASALAYWIKDCPIDVTPAIDLEERTLTACRGKLENDYKAGECIQALCSLANDENRVQIIRCIRKIVQNPPEYMYWKDSRETFDVLFNDVIENKDASQELIQEAMGLADDLGRQRDYHYKGVFETLTERLDAGSSPA